MKNKKDHIYKELSKLCDPKDFFGQVKRTVNGKPVEEEDINLIVETIRTELDLNRDDLLLDLGCGNVALASMIFDDIQGYLGVDFSEYLIEIAKKNFTKPNFEVVVDDAIDFLERAEINLNVTKILCYGVFMYFSSEEAFKVLQLTAEKYPNAQRFLIGNLPDKTRANNFFYEDIDYDKLLDDNQSSIGKWWSTEELEELAKNAGWIIKFHNMPKSFYSSHYRFDAVLIR